MDDIVRAFESSMRSLLLIVLALGSVPAIAQTGPVGNWKMDDGSGTSVTDSSGGSHTGTFVNTPTWTTSGKINGGLSFAGTTAAVTVPGGGNLGDLYTTGMSISVWINPTSAGGGSKGRIVDKTNWMLRMGSATTLEFIADQWSTTFAQRTSSATIATGQWQHVIVTWDGQQNAGATAGAGIHIYINGALADGASVNGAGTAGSDSTIPMLIGNSSGSTRGFAGVIDELRIYNRILSASEISTMGDAVRPMPPTAASASAASSSSITLSWSGATDNVGVTGYRVQRCQGAGCTTWAQVSTPTSSPWTDTGLTASTVYRYQVFSVDANANVSNTASPIATATTSAAGGDTVAPTAPSGVVITAASSVEIDLSWNASTDNVGVTAYEYERCQGASCSTITVPPGSPAPVTYLFDAGRAGATAYTYRLRAKDAAGNSSAWSSPTVNFTTPASSPDCN